VILSQFLLSNLKYPLNPPPEELWGGYMQCNDCIYLLWVARELN
jgi:hypothetical protein